MATMPRHAARVARAAHSVAGLHGKARGARRASPAFLKVRAILAGGLVLGVGGSLTMASWTDSESGTASFTSSTFDLESSLTSATTGFSSHASPVTLAFNGTGMSPNQVRYAAIWVRNTSVSIAGSFVINAPTPVVTATTPDMTSALRVRVVSTSVACGATAFSTGTPTFVIGSAGVQPLATASSAVSLSAGGTTVPLCFEISMISSAPNTMQGAGLTLTWEIRGTSV